MDYPLLRTLKQYADAARVRADANNAWRDWEAAAEHLAALAFAFNAVEEPLAPRDYDGMRALGRSLGAPIILDESAVREADLADVSGVCP